MRSSEAAGSSTLVAACCVVACSLVVASCSAAPGANQTAATAKAAECVMTGVAPQDAETAADLRRTTETGPLYAIVGAKSSVAACRISTESNGVTLEYMFQDGAWLHVTHDARIEYSNQEVHFAAPPTENLVDVLTRTEKAAFTTGGCGINWQEPETKPASDDSKATENIYRGDVCNCQARVRKDAGGRVIGLIFRSTC